MILSFIGMSGAGKSRWSNHLENEKGYKKYSCDELIEKELSSDLASLGCEGVGGLSRWMGQPYDERYARNSRRYLELEVKVLEKILEEIERGKEKKTVVDTTGSVVYLPEELLRKLKQLTKVVYLETPESMVEKMIAIYFADPKPVIWGDSYRPLPDEEKMKALKRCYPALLRYRMSLYEKLADVKVDRSEVERLLDAIT